jgi:hypothetical protein
MVQHVVGFLPHLHQHIHHLQIHLPKPTVFRIELISQYQTQGMGAVGGGRTIAHALDAGRLHQRRRWRLA